MERTKEPLRVLVQLLDARSLLPLEKPRERLCPPLLPMDRLRLLPPFVHRLDEAAVQELLVHLLAIIDTYLERNRLLQRAG